MTSSWRLRSTRFSTDRPRARAGNATSLIGVRGAIRSGTTSDATAIALSGLEHEPGRTQIPTYLAHLSWGHVEVEGHPPFKDTKVFPGGAREWDWRETGTRHVPGIQPADVQELIEHGAKAVVLSKGIWERLQVRSVGQQRHCRRGPADRGYC
jgi:hypothetical protein